MVFFKTRKEEKLTSVPERLPYGEISQPGVIMREFSTELDAISKKG